MRKDEVRGIYLGSGGEIRTHIERSALPVVEPNDGDPEYQRFRPDNADPSADCILVDTTTAGPTIDEVVASMPAFAVVAVVSDETPVSDPLETGATEVIDRRTLAAEPSLLVDRVQTALRRVDTTAPSARKPSQSTTTALPAEQTDHPADRTLSTELLPVATGIFDAVVAAETHEILAERLLDAFDRAERWETGWYGRYDPIEETITPVVPDPVDVSEIALDNSVPSGEPLRQAIEQRHPQSLQGTDVVQARPDCDPPLVPDLAVPITDGAVVHGVCVLYATLSQRVSESLRSFLEAVGRTAGTIATALQRFNRSSNRDQIELELEHDDPTSFLGRLSADENDIEVESYHVDKGKATLYCMTTATVDRIETATAASDQITGATVVADHDTERLISIETIDQPPFFVLSERYGGQLHDMRATDGLTRLTIGLPSDADVREYVRSLSAAIGEIELLARREQPASTRRAGTFLPDRVRQQLTERQYETLLAAVHGGYYEWPRQQSAEEIADSLGISQPTFTQHLRAAERTAFELLLEHHGTHQI